MQRLLEQRADHAGDRLDEGRLELGELLDRDPVHVDHGRVDRAHVASTIACLAGSSDSIAAIASCGAAMPPNVSAHSSGVCALQEDRRVARVGDRLDDVVALVSRPAYAAAGSSVSTIAPGFSCGTMLGGDRAEREVGHGEDHDVGVGTASAGVGELAAGLRRALLSGGEFSL